MSGGFLGTTKIFYQDDIDYALYRLSYTSVVFHTSVVGLEPTTTGLTYQISKIAEIVFFISYIYIITYFLKKIKFDFLIRENID